MLILLLIVFPMLAGPGLFFLGRRYGAIWKWGPAVCAGLEFVMSALLLVLPQTASAPGILPGGLAFETSGFRVGYGLLASILWLGSTLFSMEYFRHAPDHLGSYWAFQFLTLGAVQGLFLSADFMTAFCFFEMLSFCSFPWVMHERDNSAIRAGCTYLAVSVIGGLILFFGLLLLYQEAGTLHYAAMPGTLEAADPGRLLGAEICILLGFGAKAGMFPLHVWLPKAHPVAPAPASALLSGMLTKAGIYGILMTGLYVVRDGQGSGRLMLALGLVTMVLGALMALFSVHLKHTLACSSMSQIGFILTGISAYLLCRSAGEEEGAALALNGAVLHMVNHSLLKLDLFLSAGAVAMNLHALELNDIRGWGRNKPLLKTVFGIAVLGISGVPGFNGYLSKTMLHEGLLEAIHASGVWAGTEWVFLFSGGLTFAYMLKLFLCVFVEKNHDPVRQAEFDRPGKYASACSAAVLAYATCLLLPLGIPKFALFLSGSMTGEPLGHFAAFSLENLKGALISLGIGLLVTLCFVRPVLRRGGRDRSLWPKWLDLEESVYRPLLLHVLPAVLGAPARLFGENLVLTPICRGLVLAGSVFGRGLDRSTDGLILGLRRTLLREEPVRDGLKAGKEASASRRMAMRLAYSSVMDNFSFAMTIACFGIVLVFLLLFLLS